MTVRNRLDNRRPSETFDISFGGHVYTVTVGFFPDGRVGEIFIAGRKAGSQADDAARDAAIAASFALQHGASLDKLRAALTRNSAGEAEGVLAIALDAITEGRAA